VWLVLAVILTALHFPYDTDADTRSSESSSASADSGRDSAKFYEVAYLDQKEERGMDYEATAKAAAQTYRIEKWDAALYTEKLLKKPSLDMMWTPLKDSAGSSPWRIEL
jgi:hypothetical protein